MLLTNSSGAPRWETMKQSTQLWNNLANYFLFHKISWKSVHLFFHNITKKHGSRKYINWPRIQGVNRNIPTIIPVALCVMTILFWKFHENPFNRFSAMLLRGMDSFQKVKKNYLFKGLNATSWKCSQLFLGSSPTYSENFMKIRSAVFP